MLSIEVTTDHDIAAVETATPTPRPDEALVSMRASSVNRGELALIRKRDPGWRPGQDLAGVVASAAADGSGPAAGSRVVGLAELGAWSDTVAVRASRLAVIPESLDFATAAALPMAGLTALRTLRLLGPVLGRDVLVTGASGGVGHLQVQLAALSGAQVTALTRSATRVPGAHTTVTDLTDAGEFDAALDSVGGEVLTAVLRSLRPGATLAWFGSTSGQPTPLSIYDFIGHEGVTVKTYFSYAANSADDARDLDTLLDLTRAGTLDVGVSRRWALTDASAAVHDLTRGGVHGKVVLTTG